MSSGWKCGRSLGIRTTKMAKKSAVIFSFVGICYYVLSRPNSELSYDGFTVLHCGDMFKYF